jgi:hypothetical protein
MLVFPEPVVPLDPVPPLLVCTTAGCEPEVELVLGVGPVPPTVGPLERSARSSSGSRKSRTPVGRTGLVRLEPDRHRADQKVDNMTRLLEENKDGI